jgi:putative ABC transport system ATP-binding protein
MTPILQCRDVRHTFGKGNLAEEVLRGISVAFHPGETCLLLGPSGSGKTTLLSILGCMLTPTSGEIRLGGAVVDPRFADHLTRLRRDRIGFVFQHSQLLPVMTVRENLEVVAWNAGLSGRSRARRIDELLDRLGIAALGSRLPSELSGGQRQRVAVARALLHRPPIVLADEPTASLDWEHGESAVRLLVDQARAEGSLLLTVTHDHRLLSLFGRHLHIRQGHLYEGAPQ